jgi:putative ABC transport system ATP-binding protein
MHQTIQIQNLRYKWPGQTDNLLEIDSLSLNRGEHLFLMGASGSGKSSLLSLLGGVIVPQQGSLEILGTTINELKASQRDAFRADHMGYIFQQFNLVPYLSMIDNVTLPCRFSEKRFQRSAQNGNSPQQEAVRLLEHLGITGKELLRKPVTELSVGQQQRVAAARALIGSPEVLIADEPTSSLDEDTQGAFIELLFQECKEANTTLVFVSHDTRFARLFGRTVKLESLENKVTQNLVEGGAQ